MGLPHRASRPPEARDQLAHDLSLGINHRVFRGATRSFPPRYNSRCSMSDGFCVTTLSEMRAARTGVPINNSSPRSWDEPLRIRLLSNTHDLPISAAFAKHYLPPW